MTFVKSTLLCTLLLIAPYGAGISPAWAQSGASETTIAFGNREQNTQAPIDVTSETLSIDEGANTALFTGDVVVVQDEMRMYAPWVKVFYLEDQSGISHMDAKDGVTLIQGNEAAESRLATYDVANDVLVMTGDVLVTQKLSAISAEKMTVKLDDGTALMSGRVRSLLRTNQSSQEAGDQ